MASETPKRKSASSRPATARLRDGISRAWFVWDDEPSSTVLAALAANMKNRLRLFGFFGGMLLLSGCIHLPPSREERPAPNALALSRLKEFSRPAPEKLFADETALQSPRTWGLK